jgi:hypothetical protein
MNSAHGRNPIAGLLSLFLKTDKHRVNLSPPLQFKSSRKPLLCCTSLRDPISAPVQSQLTHVSIYIHRAGLAGAHEWEIHSPGIEIVSEGAMETEKLRPSGLLGACLESTRGLRGDVWSRVTMPRRGRRWWRLN